MLKNHRFLAPTALVLPSAKVPRAHYARNSSKNPANLLFNLLLTFEELTTDLPKKAHLL